MKVMTIPKLELQAALLAARFQQDICQALAVPANKDFMWTDSTTVFQRLNSRSKQSIFFADRVCGILEHTRVVEGNHVASSDNQPDAGTGGIPGEVLESSSFVRVPDSLRTKDFSFGPSTEIVKNIKLGIVTKEIDETPQLIHFDEYSFYQNCYG